MAGWEPLPWDSEFFGFSIGKAELDGADAASIAALEADAREAGVDCLYGSVDPADAALTYVVQTLGWRFVDAATMFNVQPHEPRIPRPPGLVVRPGTVDDLPGLGDIVARLADWSRFAVDPHFGREEALRMQLAWIERAATCTTDDYSLVVAEEDGTPIGFVSRASSPKPTVDTVGTTAEGSGAARYLMEDARLWAGSHQPLRAGHIAARNVRALRYISHCGFRVEWVRYLYHRWLDEDVRITP